MIACINTYFNGKEITFTGLPRPTIPSQTVSTSSIRIIVLSNDKHLNGMLAIDNLNAEKYYNVSIAKLYFEYLLYLTRNFPEILF